MCCLTHSSRGSCLRKVWSATVFMRFVGQETGLSQNYPGKAGILSRSSDREEQGPQNRSKCLFVMRLRATPPMPPNKRRKVQD